MAISQETLWPNQIAGEADYQGMDALGSVKHLMLPELFMAAKDDKFGSGSPDDAKAMFAASPSPSRQFLMLPGTEHGEELLAGQARVRANAEMNSFIAAATR